MNENLMKYNKKSLFAAFLLAALAAGFYEHVLIFLSKFTFFDFKIRNHRQKCAVLLKCSIPFA